MIAAIILARESPRVRDERIASRLRRFAWRHRATIYALCGRHSRLADLTVSFPALLFALAVPRRHFDPEPVIERVIAGASLDELAAAASIPLWTRKLPPESFQAPLPQLPDSNLFRRQIANYWPAPGKTAPLWLTAVANASLWGHEGLAIWFARCVHKRPDSDLMQNARLISLWAWHTTHPEAGASRLPHTPWTPEMSSAQAICAARDWKDSVIARAEMSEDVVADPWAFAAEVDGYAFEPVLTAEGLIETARTFSNCARSYSASVDAGATRFWLIKKDRTIVAMLSLDANPVPQIGEISALSGARLPADLVLTAHRWFRNNCPLRILPGPKYADPYRRRWVGLWRDYWLAKQCFPEWLPFAPPLHIHMWPNFPSHHRRRRKRRRY